MEPNKWSVFDRKLTKIEPERLPRQDSVELVVSRWITAEEPEKIDGGDDDIIESVWIGGDGSA